MTSARAWPALVLMLLAAGATAETGIVTLVEGPARLLRGATWYKLAAGTRVEEADIIEAPYRSQAQVEFAAGPLANLVGAIPGRQAARTPSALLLQAE